jgi:hypothetical protein
MLDCSLSQSHPPTDKENLMAELEKKATTSKKPRTTKTAKVAAPKPVAAKTTAKRTAAPKAKAKVTPIDINHEQIAVLAHCLFVERGRQHGHDAEDWLRAEEMLLGKAS